jgi:hypothetical protein
LCADNARRGVEMRAGMVTFDDFAAAPLPASPTWSEDPYGQRRWLFHLHRFAFMPFLLAAHRETGDAWYVDRAQDLTLNWLARNWTLDPPSIKSWHDHATALRLENLLYLFEYVRTREMHDDFLRGLLAAIPLHAAILSHESFYTRRSNHGLDQSYVLLLAGAVVPEFDESRELATSWGSAHGSRNWLAVFIGRRSRRELA